MRRLHRLHLVPFAVLLLALFAAYSLQPPWANAERAAQKDTPHDTAGKEDCLLCHKAGGIAKAGPAATHASFDNKMCLTCHKAGAAAAQPSPAATKAVAAPTQAAQPTTQPTGSSGPYGLPHDIAGRDDCLLCHKVNGIAIAVPLPSHASFDNKMCLTCHKVGGPLRPTQVAAKPTTAPAQATQPAAQATRPAAQATQPAATPKNTPHDTAGKEDCLLCHKAGSIAKPVPTASHASYDNKTCLACHKVAVAAAQPTQAAGAPAAAPSPTRAPSAPGAADPIPHPLEGRAACSTCHGIAGAKPYPQNHVGRPDSGCTTCHVQATSATAGAPAKLPAGSASCLKCHQQTDLSLTLSSGEKLSLYIDNEEFAQTVHAQRGLTCVACHPANSVYPHPATTAATSRELNRGVIQQACATCHQKVYTDYKDSVHGKALLEEKNLDAPSCTDCHGVHNIRDPRTALFRANSPDMCSDCHADGAMMKKYGLSTNVTNSYLNDFHGATVRLQKEQDPNITAYAAVCYDCHGIHDIKKTDDPTSSVVKANLVKTCQKCHPGADESFPAAWTSHYEPSLQKWPLVYFVNLFYSILVPGSIIGMLAFIGLDYLHVLRKRRAARRAK